MEIIEQVLAETPLLQGLTPAMLKAVAGKARQVQFAGGEMLFREGDEARQFFILTHGKVALEIYALERGPIAIQTLGEGDAVGWSWLVPPHRWRFGARAVSLTRAIALDAQELNNLCEEDVRLGYELTKRFAILIAQRLDATRLQLIDLYATPH